jgi:hypothetical protein
MARRKGAAELQVRAAFEATRTAPQCLIAAYERLVPIRCRLTGPKTQSETLPQATAAVVSPQRRRAERG